MPELLPNWNTVISPLKKDSKFWHAIWISAGRPSKGGLYQVMCYVRAKYHRAVKQAKREVGRFKAENLINAAEYGNSVWVEELQKICMLQIYTLVRP